MDEEQNLCLEVSVKCTASSSAIRQNPIFVPLHFRPSVQYGGFLIIGGRFSPISVLKEFAGMYSENGNGSELMKCDARSFDLDAL